MNSFERVLRPPKETFFLFGPRGTGKSTWLDVHFQEALRIDLLKSSEFMPLLREPSLLRRLVEARPAGSWIAIDEVQKLPVLLDEVHSLLHDHRGHYRFALTGSSARKLRREHANLLAGRAVRREMFPLTLSELGGNADLVQSLLRFGAMPAVLNARSASDKIDFLEAYCETYLRQEIQQEALVRKLDSFSRFLQVASAVSAQVTNLSDVARDVGVARSTVVGYFEVLIDTLLGFWLPAWRAKIKVKEVQHPKFYLFDPGVLRALQGNIREPLDRRDRGLLFETWLLHEVRAALSYLRTGGELSYWRTPSGTEVDLIWQRGRRRLAFEFKATDNWRTEFGAGLATLLQEKAVGAGFGVYLGSRTLNDHGIEVLPATVFCERIAKESFWE